MRKGALRLPVHILLDIDGTLLHPCRQGRWTEDEVACHATTGNISSNVQSSVPVLVPFSNPTGRIQHVILRPHVVPFLRHLLIQHALDTSNVQVHVSLYTRQSAAYCAAVMEHVLVPALQRSMPTTPVVSTQLFYRLYSADHCVRVDENQQSTNASAAPSLAMQEADKVWELSEWQKTISVSPSPLATVLVDDKAGNFRKAELTTGHAILLPSFSPRADARDCGDDACLAVQEDAEGDLYDALCGRGSTSQCGGDLDGGTASVGLLQLLTAFVQVCHEHSGTIEQLQITNPFRTTCAGEGTEAASNQRELRSRMRAHAAALVALNFLDASPQYRKLWNDFHVPREELLRHFW